LPRLRLAGIGLMGRRRTVEPEVSEELTAKEYQRQRRNLARRFRLSVLAPGESTSWLEAKAREYGLMDEYHAMLRRESNRQG